LDSHSNKRVLITGCNSFTAGYLVKELSDYEIFGCDLAVAEADNLFVCNICNKDEISRVMKAVMPNYVVHLSAITFVPHEVINKIYEINTIGTVNLLEECSKSEYDIKKILLPSTANVYGSPHKEIIDENTAPAPVSQYAVSKLAMEYAAALYFDSLPIIITRPFNYTGRGQTNKFIIPKIVEHFKSKQKEILLGNTSVIRDFSDVRFVVKSYRKLLESDAKSVKINICSGNASSIDDILNFAAEISGHRIEKKIAAEFFRSNEIHKLLGDNTLLRETIGDLDIISLRDTLEWMLQEND
jgi:nucleoside-diphosphate-sugar epimerase